MSTRGLSASFELAVGGALKENLILHGSLAFQNVHNPRRYVNELRDVHWDNINTGSVMLGGGLTYYLMPANMYVTGIVGVMGMGESRNGSNALRSRAGVGSTLSFGKEWWLGPQGAWGMGAALRGMFYTTQANIFNDLERVYGADVGLVFSTTMN